MVVGSSEVEGIAGGELRGGGATGEKWFLGSGGLRSSLGSWAAPQGFGEDLGGVDAAGSVGAPYHTCPLSVLPASDHF